MPTELPLFQIDAFSDRVFSGNPAAVVMLQEWPDDDVLRRIAQENNLSETAFLLPSTPAPDAQPGDAAFELRWFTPAAEVDLCGHATLASAWLVLNRLLPDVGTVWFTTRSGWLSVCRSGQDGLLAMDFPANMPKRIELPHDIVHIIGATPVAAWSTFDLLLVLDHQHELEALEPDMAALRKLDFRGVIVTAPSDDPSVDFVSRFFAPKVGVDEDPVTGSAHTILAPYWGARLNKRRMYARQLSARRGDLGLQLKGDRVVIEGRCAPYLAGTITV